jgi:hypothetical protein
MVQKIKGKKKREQKEIYDKTSKMRHEKKNE